MPLPSSLALTDIPDGSSMVASPVRNNFLAIQNAFNTLLAELVAVEAWQSYVPAWTSSGVAPVPNNGTIVGKYVQVGKTVVGHILLTMGSTTTFGTGNYSFSLPVAAAAGNTGSLGNALANHPGVNAYGGLTIFSTATTVLVYTPASPAAPWTNTVPFTFASGDLIEINFTYEAA